MEVMNVSLDPKEVFEVMQCAYRHGVLQKFTVIQGEALQAVTKESGWNLGDLLNLLDEAKEETVTKIESLLNWLGPVIKYANNEHMMGLASKVLDLGPVRKMMVTNMKKSILKVIPGQVVPSLPERIKALAGRAA
jgi:hypothetical protein